MSLRKYTVHMTIPEQSIVVDVWAISRADARKITPQQITVAQLPSSPSMGISEADDDSHL